MQDRWRWTLSGDGEFSVSTLRGFIDDKTIASVDSKTRWNNFVPSKINILAWRIKHDFLPTRYNISRRGIDLVSIACASCTLAETTSHIFFTCSLTNHLYLKIARWWNVTITDMTSYEDWYAWFSALRFESKRKKIFEGSNDNNDDLSSDEEEPKANNIDETSDVDRVSESSFMQEMDHVIDSVRVDSTRSKTGEGKSGENEPHSEDNFKIYDLLKKNNNNTCNLGSEEPKYPPGFTPSFNDQEKIGDVNLQGISDSVQSLSNKIKDRKKKCGMSSLHNTYSGSQKHKVGGSILDLMDELVNVGQTMGYNMEGCLGNKAKMRWINELCHKHKINFVTLQETKAENIDLCSIKELWGNLFFDHVVGSSVGCSGGIVCVWDPNMFVKDHVSKSDYFVALMGTWIPTSTKLLIISVYAHQELSEKRDLWDYLHLIINRWDGETVIMGDFNEVRSERERFGYVFNQQGTMVFNNFISSTGLIDLPLDGYAFTWSHKSASKMSKLD
ncbi:RNA-directed DNA polymerase, eukaryota [Tanacetum coccineum]|uniref:RNA-directed DNA polymerase, eukaryota n=1 Tax=Tanacetum coccineum TaxID=301880 RepID=A0ABQ5AIV5_9ASTR